MYSSYNIKFRLFDLIKKHIDRNMDVIEHIRRNHDFTFMKLLFLNQQQINKLAKIKKINVNNPIHYGFLEEMNMEENEKLYFSEENMENKIRILSNDI